MKLNIRNFVLIFVISFLAYTYGIYTYSFYQQEEHRAEIIYKNLSTNINELAYNLSKELIKKDDIIKKRTVFDRIVANNDFINSILVFDDINLLLTTNPTIKKIDTLTDVKYESFYERLENKNYISTNIRFYDNKKLNNLLILYVLEKDEITAHFQKVQLNFFINFLLFILSAFIIYFYFLKKFVSIPLEELRQYAYYHTLIPNPFKIKELEAIRYSMIDTITRLEKEKDILYNMARTDSLSGLANRNSLNEFLERLIPNCKRNKKEFAYLFLDLDNFKSINDSLGHNIGDELLQGVSKKLHNILRPSDFVARIGGDEFTVIIQDYHNYSGLISIIQRIHKCISTPWLIQKNTINISCSVGIAIFPKDGDNTITLMKNSDIAMYEAKKLGRNQYHFFTKELNTKVQSIISLSENLKTALENNEYELYYQPKVDIKTSKIVSVEALIRWNSKTKGLISPDVFIPLAEENGFINNLGEWIIDEALKQYIKWKAKGIDLIISINISAKQICQKDFTKKLITKIDKLQIPHNKIDLEITESMFLENNKQTNKNLDEIKNKGISISLDDFGTGYSSLSYLKKLPINYLKIDKAFLDDYDTQEGAIFLETIVKLAQTLNIKIIAEGVEDENQLHYLKNISCDQYQGYYFSKPLKTSDFEKLYFRIIS